jgi:glycosyltransferase involved in cell wall biosynthesis
LERWIGRQSFQDFEWIVVDDCDPPTPATMDQRVIRPEPRWSGGNSQFRNMLAGLEQVRGGAVMVIEDDDWYAPDYLGRMAEHLATQFLVGESLARYYHVGRRQWREYRNSGHASLCQTGFRKELLPAVADICRKERWLDQAIWKDHQAVGSLIFGGRVIGMKGMPGRGGISDAHRFVGGSKWSGDPGMDQIHRWIGPDHEEYRRFANGHYHRNDPAAGRKLPMDNAKDEELKTFFSRGQIRYRCPDCTFDSYSPAEVRKHWSGTHRQPAEPGPVLFDADDKPIQKEIYVPAGLRDIGSGHARGPRHTAELRPDGAREDTSDREEPGDPHRRLHAELPGREGHGPDDPDPAMEPDDRPGRAGEEHGPAPGRRPRRRAGAEPATSLRPPDPGPGLDQAE